MDQQELDTGRLSGDGAWLAYQISRVNEENELRVRRVGGDEFWVVPYGTRATFSKDSRWLAYSIGVSEKERKKLAQLEQAELDEIAQNRFTSNTGN